MNKSYRSIYNESLGAWVAASEITRARGKASCSSTTAGLGVAAWRLNGAASAVALALGLLAPVAQAGFIIDGSTTTTAGVGITCAQPGANNVWTCQIPRAGGGFATITGITGATGADAVAAATTWASANQKGINSIILGTTTTKTVLAGTASNADGAVAIGAGAQATESSVAVGVDAQALNKTSTAVGFQTKALGIYSVALGSGAKAEGDLAYAMGNNALTGERDVALGAGALNGSTSST